MNPTIVRALANFLSVLLAPFAKAAWGFIKLKFKIGKNNTKIEKELENLQRALEEYDSDTPITEEQKKKIIDAARQLIRGQ